MEFAPVIFGDHVIRLVVATLIHRLSVTVIVMFVLSGDSPKCYGGLSWLSS
jgi:hypothetical protein